MGLLRGYHDSSVHISPRDDNFSLLYVLNILRQYGADVDIRIFTLRGITQFNNGADATNIVLPRVSPSQQMLVLADKMDITRLRTADVGSQG